MKKHSRSVHLVGLFAVSCFLSLFSSLQAQTSTMFSGSLTTNHYKFNRPSSTTTLSGEVVYFQTISFITSGSGTLSVTVNPSGFAAQIHLYRSGGFTPFSPTSSLFQDPTSNAQTATSFGVSTTITNILVISGTSSNDVGSFTGSLAMSDGTGMAVSVDTNYHNSLVQGAVTTPSYQLVAAGTAVSHSVYARGMLPHTFQWYQGFRPPIGTPPDPANIIAGATNSTYNYTGTNSSSGTQRYWCWITGTHYPSGSVTNIRSSLFSVDVGTPTVSFSGSIDAGDCDLQSPGCSGFPGTGHFEVLHFQIFTAGSYTITLTPGFTAMTFQGFFVPSSGTENCWGALSGYYSVGEYDLVVTGSGNYSGTIGSGPNVLAFIPPIPPTFLQNPLPTTVKPGTSAHMTTSTTCGIPRSLQWYKGISGNTNEPIPGAITVNYTTPPLTNDAFYWVRMTHAGGTIDSDTGPVYVTDGPISYSGVLSECDKVFDRPEMVGSDIIAISNCYYKTFVFSVGTSGSYSFNLAANGFDGRMAIYQSIFLTNNPRVNLYKLGGTTLTTVLDQSAYPWYLTISSANAGQVGTFTVTVNTNSPAFVTKTPAPIVTVQPVTTNIFKWQIATLSVATDSRNVAYQWYTGLSCSSKVPISSANSNSYTTPIMTCYSNYWVDLSNPGGYVFSQLAAVQIIPEAFDDNVAAVEDVPSTLVVLTNDIKADNRSIMPIIMTNPSHGTVVVNGDGTLTYTPFTNYYGQDSFTYAAYDGTLTSSNATVYVTVAPVADTPSVTPATTRLNQQSTSELVISRHPADGAEVTHFKITGIQNGSLFQNNGSNVINNGDFITFAQGAAGLKFSPEAGLFSPFNSFSFNVQASLTAGDGGIGGDFFNALVRVGALPIVISSTSANVKAVRATLNGVVMPRDTNVTLFFQYGLNTSYGRSTAPQVMTNSGPASMVSFTAPAVGLLRGTTYHFRVAASNATDVTYGPDQTFTTLVVDPTVPQFTTLNYFQLGEKDADAVTSNVVGISMDSIGTNHLTANNSPVYSTNVSTVASQTTSSQLAVSFSGTNQYLKGSTLYPTLNNFCFEAWVKLPTNTTPGLHVIAYNGSGNLNGWGLYQLGDQIMGLHATIAWVPQFNQGAIVSPGVWTHVALVESNSWAFLYVNGVAVGSPSPSIPLTPDNAGFAIGYDPRTSNPYGAPFAGSVDEVRFSLFAPGTFNTNALLLNNGLPPQVSTVGASNITVSSALLNASVFTAGSPGSVYFQYGADTNYGSFSATNIVSSNLNTMQPVAIPAFGLSLANGATSHYRVVMDFGPLGTAVGQDVVLQLPGMSPRNYFRLGEIDAGATAGSAVVTSLDSIGTNHLTASNSPVYTSNISTVATNATASALGVSMNGTNQYLIGPGLLPVMDNFCLEAWVKLSVSTTDLRVIAYNGAANYNGWGLYQYGNQVMGLYATVAWLPGFDAGPHLTFGEWTHVALVMNNSAATIYTNGVAAGAPVFAYPVAPVGAGFGVGTDPYVPNRYGGTFNGSIDEVRFSTFLPGQFTTKTLLFHSRPLRMMNATVAGGQVQMNVSAVPGRAYQLQSTTNLMSPVVWQYRGAPMMTPTNGQLQFIDSTTESRRFYRVRE